LKAWNNSRVWTNTLGVDVDVQRIRFGASRVGIQPGGGTADCSDQDGAGAVATDPNPCDPRRVYGGGRPGLRRPQNLWRLAALDRYELARHHHATASRKVGTFRLGAFKKNREYRQDWDEGVAIFRQDDPVDVRIPDLQSFNGTTQFSP
jgi:hypothetical protein